MPLEIERKYRVIGDGWRDAVSDSSRLRQGYLNEPGRCSIRVRVADDYAELNIKAAVVGAARAEYEYRIPVDEAESMLDDFCAHPPIEKVRHRVMHAGHMWEVDEFHGANGGLVIAEIELNAADEAFEIPPWLGREVTDERRFYNHALANNPFNQWEDHG